MCRDTKQSKKAIDEAKLKAITDRISKKKAEAIKGQRTTKQLDRPASVSHNNKKTIVILPPPSANPNFPVKRLSPLPITVQPMKKTNKAAKKSKN